MRSPPRIGELPSWSKEYLGLEHLCYGDKLGELGLFSLDKALPVPKGATRELERDFLHRQVVIGQGGMALH